MYAQSNNVVALPFAGAFGITSYNVWSVARLQEKSGWTRAVCVNVSGLFVESAPVTMMSFARACSYKPNGREDHCRKQISGTPL